MLDFLKEPILQLLRVPPEPQPPAGDRSSLKVFRAARGFYRYRVLSWFLKQAMSVIGITVALFWIWSSRESGDILVGRIFLWLEMLAIAFILLQIPFSFLLLRLDYEMRWYQVTDRSLRIREGIWHVREMTMTFANVQNIEVSQGPLQRIFGIADLKVQTAGGGGMAAQGKQGQEGVGFNMHLGYFRGIENAQEVRDMMLERLRRYRDAGLGDLDESADPQTQEAAPELESLLSELGAEAAGLRRAAEALS